MANAPVFYTGTGTKFSHQGVENEELVFEILCRRGNEKTEGIENVTLELSVTNQYETMDSQGQHVFGRRLITDSRLSWELVPVHEGRYVVLNKKDYSRFRIKCKPLHERYGAAFIQIIAIDNNYDPPTVSEPYHSVVIPDSIQQPNVEIVFRRIDNKPVFTHIQDIVIPKNGLSKVVEFKLSDEESETRDLNFQLVSEDPEILDDNGIIYCKPVLPIANGGIKQGLTYQVSGGKEIRYSSRVIREGNKFKGLKGFNHWGTTDNSTGHEQVFELDGDTRAFQLRPNQDVTGTAKVSLYLSDKLTFDYAGILNKLVKGPNKKDRLHVLCSSYIAGKFWIGRADGVMIAKPDHYKNINDWTNGNGKNWDSPKVKIVTAEEDEYNVNDKDRVISRVEGITSGVLRNGLPVIVLAVRNTEAKEGIIYYSLDGGETFTRINNYTNLEGSRVDSEGKPLLFNELRDVTFGHGNGVDKDTARFIAVGEKGTIYSSVDAVTWFEEAVVYDVLGTGSGQCILTSVKYADGKYVVVGSDEQYARILGNAGYNVSMELIFTCFDSWVQEGENYRYKPVWKPINENRCNSIQNVSYGSPKYVLSEITDISYSAKVGWVAVGRVKELNDDKAGSYFYTEKNDISMLLIGGVSGSWREYIVPKGRGNLLGISYLTYFLAVGANQTIVMFDTTDHFFLQWKSTDDVVTEEEQETAQDLLTVTSGDDILFIGGRFAYCLVSVTPIRFNVQQFAVTVTDWWHSKDFLPRAIKEHPLFDKTAQLLDYLIANNHIFNMIKIDNLAEGKSIHFNEEYFTSLLTDNMFAKLDIAQDNKESLALIAANMYNLKGTKRGLQYMLSFLTVDGQGLGAEVFDWKQVNSNLEEFGLVEPLDACTVFVRAKVPLKVYLSEDMMAKLDDAMRYFFWICLNIIFGWIRTVRTEATDIKDRFVTSLSLDAVRDKFEYGHPYDKFKFDGLEVFENIFPIQGDFFNVAGVSNDFRNVFPVSAEFLIDDTFGVAGSFGAELEEVSDLIDFIDVTHGASDTWSPADQLSWVSDSFDWPEVATSFQDEFEQEDDLGASIDLGGLSGEILWDEIPVSDGSGIESLVSVDGFADDVSLFSVIESITVAFDQSTENLDLSGLLTAYINEGPEWGVDIEWGSFYYGEFTEFRVLSEIND